MRLGVGANAALLVVFALVPALLGIAARALHPALGPSAARAADADAVRSAAVIGALALAVLFTTGVNTADAVLFMLSTSLAQDLYRGHVNPAATDAQVLRVARLRRSASGALGIAAAIVAASIVDALTIFYTLVGVSLFVPIVGGLFVRRAGPTHAFASIAAGIGVTLAVHLATAGQGIGGVISPAFAGHIAAALAFGIALAGRSRVTERAG